MAEAWPTEDAATKAVEAVARKAYEKRAGGGLPTWDDLPANEKVTVKNAVLPLVWATLEALPDPRHGAWAEGYAVGQKDWDAAYDGDTRSTENPYPSGL